MTLTRLRLASFLFWAVALILTGTVASAQQPGGSSGSGKADGGKDSGVKSDGGKAKKSGSDDETPNKYNEAYYIVDAINTGLPPADPPVVLESPLEAVESFILACRDGDFTRAARVLDLSPIPEGERVTRGPELAERLYYVLNQKLWVDWESLPARPDGQIDREFGNSPLVGKPMRSIEIGSIVLEDRVAPVRIHRVKAGDAPPIWLFTPQTVRKIDPLYKAYGPGWLEKNLPEWAKVRLLGRIPAWEWIALAVALVLSLAVGWYTRKAVGYGCRIGAEESWHRGVCNAVSTPIGVAAGALVLYIINLIVLTLTGPIARVFDPLVLVLLIGSIAWIILAALDYATSFVIDRFVNDTKDGEPGASKTLLTRMSVARRMVTLVAVLTTIGVVLSQLQLFKTVGYALLATAGMASLVLGIAAQPILGNMMAGIQIALTQPVRIGDAVLFEGHWGWVEEIAFNYLVIRRWDLRRVVVPLQYLISHPFENWSKNANHLTRPIYVNVDYRADVDAIRAKYKEMLEAADEYDGSVPPVVQVTDAGDDTITIRALCSAKDPSKAWDLQCKMREQLIAFVDELDDGKYLPRQRLRVESMPDGDGSDDPGTGNGRAKRGSRKA